jgi:hypothetical protein
MNVKKWITLGSLIVSVGVFVHYGVASAAQSRTPAQFLKTEKSTPKLSPTAISEGNKILEGAVKEALRVADNAEPITDRNLRDVFALFFLLLKQDPSNYAMEVFYPLYEKRKSRIDEFLSELPKEDRTFFESCRKTFEREQAEGNG